MIDLTSKLGEINGIEHLTRVEIYPQHQVILDCIILFMYIYIYIYIYICNIFFNFSLFGKNGHGIVEKRWLFSIGNGTEIQYLEMGRKSLDRFTDAVDRDIKPQTKPNKENIVDSAMMGSSSKLSSPCLYTAFH